MTDYIFTLSFGEFSPNNPTSSQNMGPFLQVQNKQDSQLYTTSYKGLFDSLMGTGPKFSVLQRRPGFRSVGLKKEQSFMKEKKKKTFTNVPMTGSPHYSYTDIQYCASSTAQWDLCTF